MHFFNSVKLSCTILYLILSSCQ